MYFNIFCSFLHHLIHELLRSKKTYKIFFFLFFRNISNESICNNFPRGQCGSLYESTTPLPYAILYENINRGGNHIFFNLVKGRCYKASDIGILNNVASQIDTFNNCNEDCTLQVGFATVRIYADTPKRCLENLSACFVDMDKKSRHSEHVRHPMCCGRDVGKLVNVLGEFSVVCDAMLFSEQI